MIITEQRTNAQALATLKVDAALRALHVPFHMISEGNLSNPDLWGVNSAGIVRFKLPSSEDDLAAAAVVTFPNRITELTNVFRAAVDLDEAHKGYIAGPWHPVGLMKTMSDISPEDVQINKVRGENGSETVRRLFDAYHLMPDVRDVAA